METGRSACEGGENGGTGADGVWCRGRASFRRAGDGGRWRRHRPAKYERRKGQGLQEGPAGLGLLQHHVARFETDQALKTSAARGNLVERQPWLQSHGDSSFVFLCSIHCAVVVSAIQLLELSFSVGPPPRRGATCSSNVDPGDVHRPIHATLRTSKYVHT